MPKHTAPALVALLTAALVCSAFTFKGTPAAPQKVIGRTVPGQIAPRPHPSPLDVIYSSTDVPRDIPDGPNADTAVTTLTIPDDILIEDLNVMVTITHTWVRDLRIGLRSPNGTEALLLDLFPADSIVNLTDTWFDDEATTHIFGGAPPFTGRFRAIDSLGIFDGVSAQGTWSLHVYDRFALDTGRVEAWAIEVNRERVLVGTIRDRSNQQPLPQVRVDVFPDSVFALTDAAGQYGFEALMPDTYTVRFSLADYDTLEIPDVILVEGQVAVLDTSLVSPFQNFNYASSAPPVEIPDVSVVGAQMTLDVPDSLVVADLDVTVNITHSWIGDLGIFLIGPGADTVGLTFVGAECLNIGANMVGTRFDDEAEQLFSQGVAPFTGSFRPHGALSEFDGTNAQGTWTLRVVDNCPDDVGSIQSFTLHVRTGSPSAADNPFILHPASFILSCYPNPFNAITRFEFTLDRASPAELVIFDLTGRRVATVVSEHLSAGAHSAIFDAAAYPSGLYLARLSTPHHSHTRKLILLK